MTEGELKKHLEAAEKSPKEIAAAVSGLSPAVLRYRADSARSGASSRFSAHLGGYRDRVRLSSAPDAGG